MKTKNILIATFLAGIILTSCTKTLILSDGQTTKKIQVYNSIEANKDEANNTILSFTSFEGTKYTINTSKYSYVIK